MHPKKIILAVPVCPSNAADDFHDDVDIFFSLYEPQGFYVVNAYYLDFGQVSDKVVIDLLNKSKRIINQM